MYACHGGSNQKFYWDGERLKAGVAGDGLCIPAAR